MEHKYQVDDNALTLGPNPSIKPNVSAEQNAEMPEDIQIFTTEAEKILEELRENLNNNPETAKEVYETKISTFKKQYYCLSMKYHPDKNPEGPKEYYEELFKIVGNSYGDLIKKGSRLLNGETIYDDEYFEKAEEKIRKKIAELLEELSVSLKADSIFSLLNSIFAKKSAYIEKYNICKPSKEEADLEKFFEGFFEFHSEIDPVKKLKESPKQRKEKLAEIEARVLSFGNKFEAFLNDIDKKFMERYELKYSKKYTRVILCAGKLPEKIEVDTFYLIEIRPAESKTVGITTYKTSAEIELFIPEIGCKNLKFTEIDQIDKIFPLNQNDHRRTQHPEKYPSFPTQNESAIEITDETLKKLLLGALGAIPLPLSLKLILMAIEENISEFSQAVSETFAFVVEKASELFSRIFVNNPTTSEQAVSQDKNNSVAPDLRDFNPIKEHDTEITNVANGSTHQNQPAQTIVPEVLPPNYTDVLQKNVRPVTTEIKTNIETDAKKPSLRSLSSRSDE